MSLATQAVAAGDEMEFGVVVAVAYAAAAAALSCCLPDILVVALVVALELYIEPGDGSSLPVL